MKRRMCFFNKENLIVRQQIYCFRAVPSRCTLEPFSKGMDFTVVTGVEGNYLTGIAVICPSQCNRLCSEDGHIFV